MNFINNIYEDEVLCSYLARYHRHSGNKNVQQTYLELFGDNAGPSIRIDMPVKLGLMVKNLNNNFGVDYYINNHTLYPVFFPFMRDEHKAKALDMINLSTNAKMGRLIKPMTNSIKHSLKYCPVCYEEDMILYGESYFRRVQQVPYTCLCNKHLCELHIFEHNISHTKNLVCLSEDKVNTTVIPYDRASMKHHLSLKMNVCTEIFLLNYDLFHRVNKEAISGVLTEKYGYGRGPVFSIFSYINQTMEVEFNNAHLHQAVMQHTGMKLFNDSYFNPYKQIMVLYHLYKGDLDQFAIDLNLS